MYKNIFSLRLKSPLVHTEEVQSNISTLFKEKRIIDGKIHYVPAVKGNSIRGIMRDAAFDHLCRNVLDGEKLSLDVFYILFSGGFLDSMESTIDMVAKKKIRDNLPALSILGSALGNEMLRGKLIIGSAYPRCKEMGNGEVSVYDMTNIIRYTRNDDAKGVHGDDWSAVRLVGDKPQQMFYDVETLVAGAELDFTVILDSLNEIETACLGRILHELAEKPYFGGKSAIGNGEWEFLGEIGIDPQPYDEFLENHKAEIKDFLLSFKK